jgi:uncharacterized cupredoxin-like copper-binding protein
MLRVAAALLGASALTVAGCGGGGGGGTEKSSGGGTPLKSISISEKEFSLTPSTVSLSKTGTYEFKVTNNGQITHALEVEGNGVEEKTGDIDAGQSATLTVDLSKPGSYEIYCPIDGHKGQGMEGTLTVGGASAGGGGGTTTTTPKTTSAPGY